MEYLGFNNVDGLRVADSVTQEHVDKMKKMELYPDDVWVVGYPRSGTTWTQWIVRLIQNNGQPDNVPIYQASPWVEGIAGVSHFDTDLFCQPEGVQILPRPRTMKSHFPYDFFPCGQPCNTPCKYIYMARNPKDIVASMYCLIKQAYIHHLEWEGFLKFSFEGTFAYGDYFDHVLSWWAHRNDENILFLKYEDRKDDLTGQIKQIANFMGIELASDTLSKIVELSRFDRMKKDDRVNNSRDKKFDKDGEPTFLRKGVVGDWKNFFTPEQSRQMDIHCAKKLKDTELEFDYE